MNNSQRVLIIGIYSHPAYYPPTLNALEYLAGKYKHIYLVHRNVHGFDWVYPPNVTLLWSGALTTSREAEQQPMSKKIRAFLQFTSLLYKTYKSQKGTDVLIYDGMPVLSYRLINFFIQKPAILWYHNHDVAEKQYIRKWSLTWWAWRSERWIFPRLTIFSLPAVERKDYFPMERLQGRFVFLPNFPSRKRYAPFAAKHTYPQDTVRILYQGQIGELHGLEEIIGILGETIQGKSLQLVLKGFINPAYRAKLDSLAAANGTLDKLVYVPPTGYDEVIENAATCHIGVGIHMKQDIMNKTLGSSSNKIYEYAALGLPALLNDNGHFRSHLERYKWAFFTDCSEASLVDNISEIISNYAYYSEQAKQDFNATLNFEQFFLPLLNSLG